MDQASRLRSFCLMQAAQVGGSHVQGGVGLAIRLYEDVAFLVHYGCKVTEVPRS